MGRTERIQPGTDFMKRLVGEGRVDGFLVQRRDETDYHEFAHLIEGTAPVVLINSRGSRRGSAVLDDAAGARRATEHLLDLGHRDIALIGGDIHSHTGRARERGYVEALNAAGMRRRSAWVLHSGYNPEAGRLAVHQLCTTTWRRPTGIVASNVNAAMGVFARGAEIGSRCRTSCRWSRSTTPGSRTMHPHRSPQSGCRCTSWVERPHGSSTSA